MLVREEDSSIECFRHRCVLKIIFLHGLQWCIHNTGDFIEFTSDPGRKIAFMVCDLYMRSECNTARSSFMKDLAGYKNYYGGLMISYILL